MFIILDKITSEVLAQYDPIDPDRWGWDGREIGEALDGSTIFGKLYFFETQKEAEAAQKHLTTYFQTHGHETNFVIHSTKKVVGYVIV
jgi:hypothetical protein